uniref:ADP-ribosyltransferase n=1 Tax=Capnocytophaga leadbetteri TaxID=327575 RepID=UPI0028D66588|nr:ADP-ribosyltransferase [Capnocytophaga leadbetteri]
MMKLYDLRKKYRECKKNIANYFLEYYFRKETSQIKKERKFKIFNNPTLMDKWGEADSNYFEKSRVIASKGYIPNETQEEKRRKKELRDIGLYCGYSDNNINNWLRDNSAFCFDKSIKDSLDNIINSSIIKDDIIVVRRIYQPLKVKNKKVGDLLVDKAFLSTSLNINYRLNYQSEEEKFNNEALCIIKVSKGTKGVYIQNALEEGKRRDEYEILFNRETQLEIEYKKRIFNNYLLVLKMIKN